LILDRRIRYTIEEKNKNARMIINKCEIRIIGLQRSGKHPIVDWIGSQCPGKKVYFLNNVAPKTNPFLTSDNVAHRQRGPHFIMFNNFRVNMEKEQKGNFVKKDCLICGYEEKNLKDIFHEYLLKIYLSQFHKR